jgi:hypothetical protein
MRGDINLTSDERAGRLRGALFMLGFTIVLVFLLAELSIAAPWWIVLGVPLFAVSTQLVQAYTGVCPHHATQGTRATPDGTELMLDPRKLSCVRARGREVARASMILAVVATALAVAVAFVR